MYRLDGTNRRYYASLYIFYVVYFLSLGVSSFQPKYFGEIGMNDAEIGMLTSIPAILGMLIQPMWGMFADRAKYKRNVLAIAALVYAGACFLTNGARSFWPILACMTFVTVMQLPMIPVASSVSMDYLAGVGRNFGPIRMVGSMGYQLGALLVGAVMTYSLKGLFALMGWLLIATSLCALLMPPVAGFQHGGKKVSPTVLLKDKNIRLLLTMLLIASTTSMFSQSFFSKRLGDLGIDNQTMSYITIISVLLELPFLFFSKRLRGKLSVWNWFIVGMVLNGLRFVGLALADNAVEILICSLPAVSVLACFEFFPSLYLNDRVAPELHSSAQTLLTIVTFGVSRITGSLLEGFLCNSIGIPTVFMINGALLLVSGAAFWPVCRKLAAADKAAGIPVV